MGGGGEERIAAVVTYPAPHGVEAERLRIGDYVAFGRGAECRLRFAHAPQPDRNVPRVAGHLVVSEGRVFVESSGTVGHRALEVRSSGGSVRLPIGEGHSPREPQFQIIVPGSVQAWTLAVTVQQGMTHRGASMDDPPTRRYVLDLTVTQQRVLAAYCAPLTRGRAEPATHKEVAAALSYHPNTVREVLYEIWAKMFEQGIPMPEVTDKRSAVVEATRIHGLLPA
jgi:hypothetical protein